MIEYHWREEMSESFGRILRPVAEIHVRDKNNVSRALTLYIDSGADVSILTRSYGELFGHNVTKGRKLVLKGIGNLHLAAYLHKTKLLIGKHEIDAEVAIAENDDVPNVLGRRDIFNLFEIQFKNIQECTRLIRKKHAENAS